MLRVRILLFWVFFVVNVDALAGDATALSAADTRCTDLAATDFSRVPDAPTQILQVKPNQKAPDSSRICLVSGYVSPSVGFKLGLPDKWSGRFIEMGCGGHCGSLVGDDQFGPRSSCSEPLRRGYACIVSDLGHTGGDTLWAAQNLQAKIDWGYRATHVVALAGKAITERYYGAPPRYSYFLGGSTGGRQALQAAQRFPWDFDGIVAVAPPVDLSHLYMTFAWGYRAMHAPNGQPILGQAELKALTDAAVEQCDLDDGVRDRVISDPLRCPFDPSQLACTVKSSAPCLTPVQLDAVRKVYAGPTSSKGVPLTAGGPVIGSEFGESPAVGWKFAYLGSSDDPYRLMAEAGLRTLFFSPERESGWSLNDFDFDRDSRRLGVMQSLYDSSNPDLRAFKAQGGKLLIVQGLNDNSVLPRRTIDYYETVERTMGGREATQSFARLFLLPGVGHGSGGPGADRLDYLGAMEAWVEESKAPDRLIAAKFKAGDWALSFQLDPQQIVFTRPVYPYPIQAHYKGRGDHNDAANFGPRLK